MTTRPGADVVHPHYGSGCGVASSLMPIMSVEHLTKHFETGGGSGLIRREKRLVHAVDDVSFDLFPGRILALVGESGSGKSTIARVLSAVHPPTSGTIRLNGESVLPLKGRRDALAFRRQVQMVLQDPFASLNPVHRIGYHVGRPLAIHHGLRGSMQMARVLELLASVGLVPPADIAAKFPHELSGGQRQRVNFACALAVEPSVILADEPVSMLDVSIRMGVLNLIRGLRDEQRLAFLYITHDLGSARYVADEIMVLYAGHMVEKAPSGELLRQPLHPYTRLLLSAVPDPRRTPARLEARAGVASAIDPKPGCRFADRCPLAQELCRRVTPEVTEPAPGHLVRCHAAEVENNGIFGQLTSSGPVRDHVGVLL